MSTPLIPTAEQLGLARTAQWHQNGEALLTFENLRSWMNVAGLVLFTPRAQQLPSPAPSFVEAVLGTPNAEPTLADTEQARSLLARLIAEGIAVPLNLLGTPGETPDFIVSAPVFSYIFTLRGDKAWKQPPVTSGAVKVSPLAAATYEVLTRRPMLSAYDLATELGKEVTETAVLRSLNELWSHLRVLPIAQEGAATLWELASARFTKQIKAGANAGQPSALSALISLYLGNALLASEEEIETFLSPLASRSRIRDVVHALMGARELESLAVEGRTLLHVSGSLPAFITPVVAEEDETENSAESLEVEAAGTLEATDAPRIKKFVAKPRKLGTGFPSDFGRKFNGTPLDSARESRGASGDRERRPFKRDAAAGGRPDRSDRSARPARPTFNKPWDEDKRARPAAAEGEAPARTEDGGTRPAFSRKPSFGSRPAFGEKRSFGDKRPGSFGDKRPGSFGDKRPGSFSRDNSRGRDSARPSFRRDDRGGQGGGFDSRPPRREFTPRTDFAPRGEGDSSAPRKTFSKPGTFGRKREGFSSESRGSFAPRTPGSYSPRPQGGSGSDRGDRGDRGSFAPRKPFTPGGAKFGGPKFGGPKFGPKFGAPKPGGFSRDRDSSEGQGERPARPTYRKFDAPRTPRPSFDRGADRGDRGDRPSFPRPAFDRPARPSADRAPRPYSARPASGEGRPSSDRPYSKPSGGGFGAKKPFSKPGGSTGKPANTFTKFANGNNPFRKPGKPGGKARSFKGKESFPVYGKRKPEGGQ